MSVQLEDGPIIYLARAQAWQFLLLFLFARFFGAGIPTSAIGRITFATVGMAVTLVDIRVLNARGPRTVRALAAVTLTLLALVWLWSYGPTL